MGDSRFTKMWRYMAPTAVALALVFSLWANTAQHAEGLAPAHALQTGVATGHHSASAAEPGEPCAPASIGSEADNPASDAGSQPALHCHAGSVQLGDLMADLAAPMPPQRVAAHQPEAAIGPRGTALAPPLGPPRLFG